MVSSVMCAAGCVNAPPPSSAGGTPTARGAFSRFGDTEDMECKVRAVAAAFVAEGRRRGWSLAESISGADAELARLYAHDPVRYQAAEGARASLAPIASRAYGWSLFDPKTVLFAYFPLCQGEKMGTSTEAEIDAFLAEALACQGRHATPRAMAAIRLELTEAQERALRACVYQAVTPLLTE